jgi:CMP-N,N'-diacetyllegionaminic acid synthase
LHTCTIYLHLIRIVINQHILLKKIPTDVKKKINLSNNYTFVIPVRKGSQRVKNKNTRKFANTNLLELKIKQLFRIFKEPNILLSTDCQKSIKIGKNYNLKIDKRPKKFASSSVPMKKVYQYLGSKVESEYVCYTNVTSPLISDTTLKKIFRIFNKKKLESITTVNIIQEYMWYNFKALNYNPNNHPRSQDLKKIQALNFAFSIVPTSHMFLHGQIFTKKFFPYVINFPEYVDVDEEKDFLIAEFLYNKKK